MLPTIDPEAILRGVSDASLRGLLAPTESREEAARSHENAVKSLGVNNHTNVRAWLEDCGGALSRSLIPLILFLPHTLRETPTGERVKLRVWPNDVNAAWIPYEDKSIADQNIRTSPECTVEPGGVGLKKMLWEIARTGQTPVHYYSDLRPYQLSGSIEHGRDFDIPLGIRSTLMIPVSFGRSCFAIASLFSPLRDCLKLANGANLKDGPIEALVSLRNCYKRIDLLMATLEACAFLAHPQDLRSAFSIEKQGAWKSAVGQNINGLFNRLRFGQWMALDDQQDDGERAGGNYDSLPFQSYFRDHHQDLMRLSGNALKLWVCLSGLSGGEGTVETHQRDLAQRTGLSVTTLHAGIQELSENGWLTYTRRGRTPSAYQLHAPAAQPQFTAFKIRAFLGSSANPTESLAELLQTICRERGWGVRDLAGQVGIDHRTAGAYLRGESVPRRQKIMSAIERLVGPAASADP